MHPLMFLAVMLAALGVSSYGIMLMPLTQTPKQAAHFGLVILFLAVLSRYYGLV